MPASINVQPIASVLIPTKNRARYLKACLEQFALIASSNLEIVVCDNSTNDESQEIVESCISSARIIYVRNQGPLTIQENFSSAIQHSSGKYIAIIGDDDGVHPSIEQIATWANRNKMDAVVSPHLASYLWPDTESRLYGNHFAGELRVQAFTGAISFPNPHDELLKVCKGGGVTFEKMPRLYHGLVARSCIDAVRECAGQYFPGPAPDMAAATALACVVRKYAWIDAAIVISGTGGKSAGGAGARGKHDWSVDSLNWISESARQSWSQCTPNRAVASTLWAESVLQAMDAMGVHQVRRQFRYGRLYGTILAQNGRHTFAVWSALRHRASIKCNFDESQSSLAWNIVAAFAGQWWKRCKSLIQNLLLLIGLPVATTVRGLPDICAASTMLLRICPWDPNKTIEEIQPHTSHCGVQG